MRYLIATAAVICKTFVSRAAKIRERGAHYVIALLIGLAFAGPAAAKYNIVYGFCSAESCTDGSGPSNGVVKDSQGNLFGTTSRGGINNSGTIFELINHSGTWQKKVIYRFCSENNCVDGMTPGALIIDTFR